MLYTITNRGLLNGRPTAIGANTISTANRTDHVFTLANFTTETSPVYSDPEGDALSYIKILQLPVDGTLQLSGVGVTLNQLIYSASISAGNFKYVPNSVDPAYSETFKFDVADAGSQSISGLPDGIITMSVLSAANQPPTCVGGNELSKNYGETHVFTMANFTTEATPVYSDPEGDAPYAVKITSLPTDGTLYFNGAPVTINKVVLSTELAANMLTYVPDPLITTSQYITFDFAVADVGSKQFISTCLS